MAKIVQYPHYLFALETQDDYRDEDGNWVTGGQTLVYKGKCREESNGKGSQLQIAGGEFRIFSSTIQLPKGTEKIKEGNEIFVSDDQAGEEIRIKGEVLKFDKGQLHSRLWV